MSWSLSLGEVADATESPDADAQHWAVQQAITEQIDTQKAAGSTLYDSSEVCQQIDAAAAAAAALLTSGTLGEGPWFVSLSGHANPGHKPTPGWSNDAITIHVSQAARPA
ncbi:MAG: hypothetical protein HOV78_20165 [Hamadaea sp.]|nr:hypothetical protein [Hamadaea sp.]NUO90597.1 hypothetical protein [Dermatophilaceae bacterium]